MSHVDEEEHVQTGNRAEHTTNGMSPGTTHFGRGPHIYLFVERTCAQMMLMTQNLREKGGKYTAASKRKQFQNNQKKKKFVWMSPNIHPSQTSSALPLPGRDNVT